MVKFKKKLEKETTDLLIGNNVRMYVFTTFYVIVYYSV